MKNFTITFTGIERNFEVTQTAVSRNFEIRQGVGPVGPAGPEGPQGEQGEPGEPGEPGPNSVTSATTTDFPDRNVLYANDGNVESIAFDETESPDTIVKRDGGGSSTFTSVIATNSLTVGNSFLNGVQLTLGDASENFTMDLATSIQTAFRVITLPDASGTVALFDESGNFTVDGTLTADHIHGNLAGSVYAHVRAGETLAKGDPVYISGSHGSGANLIPIVSKADASNAAKMPAVGIMDAALANNANGHMVITGTITELDTDEYAVNSVLYVASGGGFTSTPPAANSQAVAIVERANANNGAVIVKVNGLASSGGNGASDANKLVRFSSAGTIPVVSIGGLGTNVAAFLATPTSANLAAALTDENGTGGGFVRAEGATLTSPSLIGPVNLASQDTAAADRVMTRGLIDSRTIISQLASNFTVNNNASYNATSMVLSLTAGWWEINGEFRIDSAVGAAGARLYLAFTGSLPESYLHRLWIASVSSGATNPSLLFPAPLYGSGTQPFLLSQSIASTAAGTFKVGPSLVYLTGNATITVGMSQNAANVSDTTMLAFPFSRIWATRLQH